MRPALSTLLRSSSRGITVANMMVVVLILGILSVPMAKFITSNLKTLTKENLKVASQETVRGGMDRLERDFFHLNQVDAINFATGPGNRYSTIQFRMDINQAPFPIYDWRGDTDNDGLRNELDFDDDGDGGTWNQPALQWRFAYDLKDDDDDNDGNYDVLCQYSVDNQQQLIRQCVYNAANTPVNPPFVTPPGDPDRYQILAQNVSTFTLTVFGAVREPAGLAIDLGNDGMPATGDPGEGDRIVTAREMDWVLPAQGGVGNQSGNLAVPVLDGPELNLIYAIRIEVAQDKNRDGEPDFRLLTEIAPPLLPIKRTPAP